MLVCDVFTDIPTDFGALFLPQKSRLILGTGSLADPSVNEVHLVEVDDEGGELAPVGVFRHRRGEVSFGCGSIFVLYCRDVTKTDAVSIVG